MVGMAERWWFAPEHNDSMRQSFKKTEPKKSLQVILCLTLSLHGVWHMFIMADVRSMGDSDHTGPSHFAPATEAAFASEAFFAMLPRTSPGVNAGARGPFQTLGPGSARAGYCRLWAQQHDQGAFGWKKTQELRAADHAALGVCFRRPYEDTVLWRYLQQLTQLTN